MMSQPIIATPTPLTFLFLLTNWNTCKTAAFDVSVTSLLRIHTQGSAAIATKAEITGPMMPSVENMAVMCSPGSRDLWCMRKMKPWKP